MVQYIKLIQANMRKIFLMDDDQNYLGSLEVGLSVYGFEVVASMPIENTVTLIKRLQPDLIVLDYLMGNVYGGEVCAELKENAQTKHIPVIILTAYDKVFEALGTFGCDAYISKKDGIEVLLKKINELLKIELPD